MNKTPTTLIIMDGFGLRTETEGNAVAAANTPRLDQFFQEYAHTELSASGLCLLYTSPSPRDTR